MRERGHGDDLAMLDEDKVQGGVDLHARIHASTSGGNFQ
jgi:hypothetical protein